MLKIDIDRLQDTIYYEKYRNQPNQRTQAMTTTTTAATSYYLAQEDFPERDYLYERFDLTWEQFECFQHLSSSSLIGKTLEESLEWLRSRSDFLEENHSAGWPYCQYGISSDEEWVSVWYETTSGTLLCAEYPDDGSEPEYKVWIPEFRKEGHHAGTIQMVLSGLTLEKEKRWHNCHCLPDKDQEYTEWSTWWNTVHAPKWGLDLVDNLEQHLMRVEFLPILAKFGYLDKEDTSHVV